MCDKCMHIIMSELNLLQASLSVEFEEWRFVKKISKIEQTKITYFYYLK